MLARYHQKLETAATDDMVSTPVHNASATKEAGRSFTSLPSPPKVRRGLLSRMLGKPKRETLPPSAAVKPRKIKPLSRFEQKMLQEEKWTRETINNYTENKFKELSQIVENAKSSESTYDLLSLADEHLSHTKDSIIALYISGMLSLSQNNQSSS